MKKMIKAAVLVAGLVGSTMAFALEGEALQQELQKMVDEAIVSGSNVTATVEDGGTVMLSGYMQDQGETDNLVAKIKEVEGVTDGKSDVTTN